MAARIGRSRPVSAYIIRPKLAAQTLASIDMTLGNVTMDWSGTPTPPDGSIAVTLNNVTMDFAGTADGSGTFALQLSSITEDFAGAIINGSFALQLAGITGIAFDGSVNPIGDFSLQLSPITMAFGSETQPFGEQVLHIDAEHRAFRVIEEDPGLIQITRSEVTQA